MKRGTTPTHTFTLPFETSLLKTVRVVYAQLGQVILVKTGGDLNLSDNTVSVKLSQEDTLRFNCSHPVEIQIRVVTLLGDVHNSDIKRVSVGRCLENEVLT